MKQRIHLTKTEIALLLLTAVFILGICLLHGRGGQEGWTISVERTEQADSAVFKAININTATEEELTAVAGIGEVLAQRIVAYRQENGPFKTVEELENVKGIGPGLLEDIRELVCTEDAE